MRMRALASFKTALTVRFGDIEVGIDADPEIGLADSGDLDTDLADLLRTIGEGLRASTMPRSCSSSMN